MEYFNNFKLNNLKSMTEAERKQLCERIRTLILDVCLNTAGHLASNLGVVELTVAVHTVFDSPYDKILFDVGHQSYAHKILTGRAGVFHTIRRENGISGFVTPKESPHDAFIAGHASVAISAAAGFAAAFRQNGENNKVVAIIGDGAFSGGEVYEGLCNICKERLPVIIILNDNEYSISKNGAAASYLNKIRMGGGYYRAKGKIKDALSANAAGLGVTAAISKSKDMVKKIVSPNNWFENLGFKYFGIEDGHDTTELIKILEAAKNHNRPCIVHVRTVKGKGHPPAEENPGSYHIVSTSTHPRTDELMSPMLASKKKDTLFSEPFGRRLEYLGKDSRINVITAAMKYPTGCNWFAKTYPSRFFDVGIAEPHAVTFAAGLASCDKIPVFAVYATFLQRCYDQLLHDVAIPGLHIVLCIDRAGLNGADGVTHQGLFDIPLLTAIPNTAIYAPYDGETMSLCLDRALYAEKGLAALRYSRLETKMNNVISCTADDVEKGYIFAEGNVKAGGTGKRRLCVTYGRLAKTVLKLRSCADVVVMLKIFPVSGDITALAAEYDEVYLVEESYVHGGIGEKLSLSVPGLRVRAVTGFVEHAEAKRQLEKAGLDYESLRKFITE